VSASDNDRISYLAGEDVESLAPEERAELDELRGLLDDESVWTEPPPELEDRVVTAIADEARAQPRPGDARDGADVAGAQAPATATRRERPTAPRQRPRQRRQRRWPGTILERPIYAAGAIAALVAVVAVVTVIAKGSDHSSLSSVAQRFAMVVNGTSLAPGAHGSATLTKESSGWHISLSATGLPPLHNGRYYQAWLKNAAGILVPVGTFNDAVNVTLWSGVPVTQFRTLTVTRQQADGNPASSGQRVLIGTITSTG
jgi:Anti-sigma-K factor rskA